MSSREYRYPLERTNDRSLPPDYAGPVDVFDIDKTYLESEFENLLGLVGTALERAVDRRTRPGVGTLLRALRRGPRPDDPFHARAPLYFVSASPPQLRSVIEGKMLLDGVEWDGIAFKDHVGLVRARRFREVRRHVAYKLTALLEYRLEWPVGARESLYGDDAEWDALIYSLYAEMRAGLAGGPLDMALARAKVGAEDRRRIAELAAEGRARDAASAGAPAEARAEAAAGSGSVEAIYIFKVASAPRLDLASFPRVTAVADAVDLAARLAVRGRLPPSAVEDVRRDIAETRKATERREKET